MTSILRATVALTAALVAVLAGTLLAWSAEPTEPTELRPAALERGPDVRLPHLEGRTVVDGDVRVRVRGGDHVYLLGRSGRAYVVAVTRGDAETGTVKRVRPGADARVILRRVPVHELQLSDDGRHLVRTVGRTAHSTRVTVHRAASGSVVRQRTFAGSVKVLDGEGDRLVLGSWSPARTFWWDFAEDSTATIVRRTGYAADISDDRLATYTADPYQGGCTVVSPFTPGNPTWRSCTERVAAFSPDLGRMATVHILSDGIGPDEVRVRKANGVIVGHFTAKWFGRLVFEDQRRLLLETYGAKYAAVVRCQAATCVRASGLRPTPEL